MDAHLASARGEMHNLALRDALRCSHQSLGLSLAWLEAGDTSRIGLLAGQHGSGAEQDNLGVREWPVFGVEDDQFETGSVDSLRDT